jgi:hypothetical protein
MHTAGCTAASRYHLTLWYVYSILLCMITVSWQSILGNNFTVNIMLVFFVAAIVKASSAKNNI